MVVKLVPMASDALLQAQSHRNAQMATTKTQALSSARFARPEASVQTKPQHLQPCLSLVSTLWLAQCTSRRLRLATHGSTLQHNRQSALSGRIGRQRRVNVRSVQLGISARTRQFATASTRALRVFIPQVLA
jgi:hypothetical protein